ncbi:hypothetical protein V6N13_035334 [Hibiscus sabdariffa]
MVSRESNGGFESSTKSIEIPPPRPKRKPMHPYPRKSGASLKGISPSSQPERSPSPNHFVSEQDNKSPSSVLSAFVFGAMGSSALPASEQPNRCSIPTSCKTTNIQSLNTPPVVKDDYVTSTEKENESLSSVKKSNANFDEPVCAKGNAEAVDVPFNSIKLFGKIVEVKDSGKLSISKNDVAGARLVPALPSTSLGLHLSHGAVMDHWSMVPSKSSLSSCIEIHSGKNDRVEYTSNATVKWLALNQGLPFYYITSFNQPGKDSGVKEGTKEKETLNERSSTGSNSGSVSQTENRGKNSDSVYSQCQKSSPEGKMTPERISKGFVPYKRCLTERDMSVSEGRERVQKARVCS